MSLAGGTCMMFRKTQLAVTLLAVSLSQQSVVLSFIAANKYHRLFSALLPSPSQCGRDCCSLILPPIQFTYLDTLVYTPGFHALPHP